MVLFVADSFCFNCVTGEICGMKSFKYFLLALLYPPPFQHGNGWICGKHAISKPANYYNGQSANVAQMFKNKSCRVLLIIERVIITRLTNNSASMTSDAQYNAGNAAAFMERIKKQCLLMIRQLH